VIAESIPEAMRKELVKWLPVDSAGRDNIAVTHSRDRPGPLSGIKSRNTSVLVEHRYGIAQQVALRTRSNAFHLREGESQKEERK